MSNRGGSSLDAETMATLRDLQHRCTNTEFSIKENVSKTLNLNTKVEQLEKSIRAIDESIEVIKKLGGSSGGDTSGIVDMINDMKT